MKFNKKQTKTLSDIILHRRDVRGNNFTSKKIKNKDLSKILDAGIHAPSVGFSQPWKFVIVSDSKVKDDVYGHFKKRILRVKSTLKIVSFTTA